MRTIFVVNCIEHNRRMRVNNGELMLEDLDRDKPKTLTKIPFQKLLALFVIGHITVTTPLIEKCKKFGVALAVIKPNLRPVFFWANSAEANYLLRKRQYEFKQGDLSVAKVLVRNKVENTKRIVSNIVAKIEAYSKHFSSDDSVVLFEVDADKLVKYGNAIHRDQQIVYF
ncbi:MAG: CRISPR-associated endonuclease Cas1 [Alloprevotella sp.]|nr:CRISPR-associated endonuclease Cas1 [Alloprevotella sp.]